MALCEILKVSDLQKVGSHCVQPLSSEGSQGWRHCKEDWPHRPLAELVLQPRSPVSEACPFPITMPFSNSQSI